MQSCCADRYYMQNLMNLKFSHMEMGSTHNIICKNAYINNQFQDLSKLIHSVINKSFHALNLGNAEKILIAEPILGTKILY